MLPSWADWYSDDLTDQSLAQEKKLQDKLRADLKVVLDSGPEVHLGELRIEGLKRYPRVIITNLNPIKPGEDYSEATLPGHLHGDDEGTEGYRAGDVLDGDKPIAAALAELKKNLPVTTPAVPVAQAARLLQATPPAATLLAPPATAMHKAGPAMVALGQPVAQAVQVAALSLG